MLKGIHTDRAYVTTIQAEKISGLKRNYLTQLLRRGILEGFRPSRDWFIYTDSLERYMTTSHKPGPKGPRKTSSREPSGPTLDDSKPSAHHTE
jgi:hypothetical protein